MKRRFRGVCVRQSLEGVTAAQYEADLAGNLERLLERFKTGRYRAPAVRRVHIPKDGPGKQTRPIGIPTLEDFLDYW